MIPAARPRVSRLGPSSSGLGFPGFRPAHRPQPQQHHRHTRIAASTTNQVEHRGKEGTAVRGDAVSGRLPSSMAAAAPGVGPAPSRGPLRSHGRGRLHIIGVGRSAILPVGVTFADVGEAQSNSFFDVASVLPSIPNRAATRVPVPFRRNHEGAASLLWCSRSCRRGCRDSRAPVRSWVKMSKVARGCPVCPLRRGTCGSRPSSGRNWSSWRSARKIWAMSWTEVSWSAWSNPGVDGVGVVGTDPFGLLVHRRNRLVPAAIGPASRWRRHCRWAGPTRGRGR